MADPYQNSETPWRDRDTLRRLFEEGGMNTYEIANELGTTHVTVSTWLDKHGIREMVTRNKDRPWRDCETVRELYCDKMFTIPEVADELGCSYPTALEWLKRHGIERRDMHLESARTRRKKPPTHRITRDGYEIVETTIDGSTKSIRIHRLVMVAEYGVDAIAGNIVHHKNGIPWDNRVSNLEIMSHEEHAEIHRPVEVRWGKRKPREALEAEEAMPGE